MGNRIFLKLLRMRRFLTILILIAFFCYKPTASAIATTTSMKNIVIQYFVEQAIHFALKKKKKKNVQKHE